MGGANEICTDKTGTLTENRMTIVEYYCEGEKRVTIEQVSLDTQKLILTGSALNNNSHLVFDEKLGQEKRVGNQTECSMLGFVNDSLKRLNG